MKRPLNFAGKLALWFRHDSELLNQIQLIEDRYPAGPDFLRELKAFTRRLLRVEDLKTPVLIWSMDSVLDDVDWPGLARQLTLGVNR